MKHTSSLPALRHATVLLSLPLVLSGADGAPDPTMLLAVGGAAVVVLGGGILAARLIGRKATVDAPPAKAPAAGRGTPMPPPKREAVTPPPRPAAPPRPVAPPPAPRSEATAARQVPAIELNQPAPQIEPTPTETPTAEPAAAVAKQPLFDADKLDASLDDLFGAPEPAAWAPEPAPAQPAPPTEPMAKQPLFDADKLDASLDDLFGVVEPAARAPEPAPAPASEPAADAMAKQPLFDADKLDASLDDLFGLGADESLPAVAVTAPPEPAAPHAIAESTSHASKSFDPTLTLSSFDLSSFSLDAEANPLQAAPLQAAPLTENQQAPVPEVAMTLEAEAPPPLPTVSDVLIQPEPVLLPDSLQSEPIPTVSEVIAQPEAPKQDGLISIGKLLVDQNTLEEIIRTAEKGGKGGLTTTQVISAVKGKSLDTVLEGVNTTRGVLGSLIVGRDGLVITNTMPPDIDKDLVGALTSSLFANTDIQIKRMQRGQLKRLVLETDTSLSVLTQLEMGTLVVFAKPMPETDLNVLLEAVAAIAGTK